jgi:DNA processing protein
MEEVTATNRVMDNAEELIYALALGVVDGIGSVTSRTLIEHVGSFKEIFHLSPKEIRSIPGCSHATAEALRSFASWRAVEDMLEEVRYSGVKPLLWTEEDFPSRLRQCSDGPVLLFSRGSTDLNQRRILAIVGTRIPSRYGLEVCDYFVRELQPYRPLIISGLAYGIDICAHRSAIQNGLTGVVCLAHGLNHLYPQDHRATAENVLRTGGCWLSEYLPDTPAERENFPKRNRLIAGMADAILVVESGLKGGSMITARLGFSYSRDVFAVPGRITESKSAGCNYLIRENIATLAESPASLAQAMGWTSGEQLSLESELFTMLTPDEKGLLRALQGGNRSFDELMELTQIKPGVLSMTLLELEMKQMVTAFPGKRYGIVGR